MIWDRCSVAGTKDAEEDAEDAEDEDDEEVEADEADEEDEEDEDDAEPRDDGGNSDVESTTRVAGTGARTPPTTSAAFLLATAAVTTSNVLMAAAFLVPRVLPRSLDILIGEVVGKCNGIDR